ncbi:MAG: DNA polymerase III subunit delta [Eggerthellaceae bacterium]|nr:DNA polymerase III subunit delta [Eggerthellaceae bacterium]
MAQSKNQSSLLPVYLAVGDDALKRVTVINRLKARVAEHGDIEFNFSRFNASDLTVAALDSALNTMPFMSDLRLVCIMGAEALPKDTNIALIDYLKNPFESCIVVLDSEKLTKTSALYKAIAALSENCIIECITPKKQDLPNFVRGLAPKYNVTISDPAARMLVEYLGENTVKLDSELQKLAIAHIGNQPISVSEVETFVKQTVDIKPWEFVDALSAKDFVKCVSLKDRMEEGFSYGLLPMCVKRIKQLVAVVSLGSEGNASQIPCELGEPDWKCRKLIAWAKGFDGAKLRTIIQNAVDCESLMKSGHNPDDAFMNWVLFVCR